MPAGKRSISRVLAFSCTPLLAVCFLAADQGVAKERDPAMLAFFENEVRPLLAAKCVRCHGPQRQRGGLRLDSAAGVAQGGDSGTVVVPGRPEDSRLIRAINHDSLEMSPDEKLTDAQIATLTRWVAMGAPWPSHPPVTAADAKITDRDPRHWALQPIAEPPVPEVDDDGWCTNAIDRFVFRKLAAERLTPAPPANRRALIRRLYFGLVGLPPTPREVESFDRDPSPGAESALIERLLASAHYGEQWGRHWLDLVRYAESDGHHQDRYRPEAWRYRDYVVDVFDQDMPYDRFILQQLAGDEIDPDNAAALTATGYLRHWIFEGNQRKVDEVRQIILNDVTDVTGEVFLGLSVGCARCHDHKFDPILQEDYYRLQSFFAAMVPRDDVIAVLPQQRSDYLAAQQVWDAKTADIRRQIAELEAPIRKNLIGYTFELFPQHIKDLCRKPTSEQTPLEQAVHVFAERHLAYEQRQSSLVGKLKGKQRQLWNQLHERLANVGVQRPDPPRPMTVSDIGPVAPVTRMEGSPQPLEPRFPVVFGHGTHVQRPGKAPNSTGRRSALARWIASADNPLTARVIVNRIWQYHFGRGLVATSSDFGRLGSPPTHPELLDWLARRFIEEGWKFKPIHRLILDSATYRQSALWPGSEQARLKDPTNRWLWRMNIRRLSAEQFRDAVLAVTGELDRTVGGPSVELLTPRRTIYLKVFRNDPYELLQTLDAPDGFNSTAVRDVSTTPIQALLLMNGDWMLKRAEALMQRVAGTEQSGNDVNSRLYHLLYARMPDDFERAAASDFLECSGKDYQASHETGGRLIDFCHVLLNANEFVYVD